MKAFAPGLFDKLIGLPQRPASAVITRLSIEELKDAVARDLEALLNTRAILREESLKEYPECARSILTYGMQDFAGLSLASTDDRHAICRWLEQSVARHEPRLRSVRASLETQQGGINKLSFSIAALLVVSEAKEPVNFDAILQPSSLQYSISKARQVARIGI